VGRIAIDRGLKLADLTDENKEAQTEAVMLFVTLVLRKRIRNESTNIPYIP